MLKILSGHRTLLFLVSCLIATFQAFADYVEIDGLGYQTRTDGTAALRYPVVKVVANTVIFPEYGHLVLPETIEYKGRSYRLTQLDETVFKECSTLTGITFNEGLESIGDEAFIDCQHLSEVHFSSTLKHIGVGVFENTPWLNAQPDGLLYAGPVALLYKGMAPEGTELTLSDATRHVATSAFYGQRGITACTLPEGLQTIGSGAFCSCKGLTAISLPSTLESFGNDCFRDCFALQSVVLPDGVTEIGSYAFINCSALASVTLPAQLENIQFEAFVNCKALTALTLPAGLRTIGRHAFDKCPALFHIETLNPEPPACAHDNVFSQEQYDQAEVLVPAGSLAAYQAAKGWKNFKHLTEIEPTAVSTVQQAAKGYRLQGRTLSLSASAAALGVSVYDITGQLLYTGHATRIPLPAARLCLVRIGHTVHKVLVP